MLDLAGEPALVLRRADPRRPAPVIAHVNRAFAELAGLAPDALVGRSLRALRGLLGPREALDELLRAAARGEPVAGQVELSRAGGAGPAALALRGRRLERRPDLYLAWLAEPAASRARPGPGEPARYLAGLTRECLYELAVEVDCRLRLLWADPRLAELTGYAAEELADLGGFFALVVEADRAELHRRNQRLLAGQQAAARYRLRRKDGSLRLVRDAARPEWAPDGRAVARVVGALADLSAERAEAPLMPLLEREAQLVAAALDAFVLLLDAQGRVRWAWGREIGGLTRRLRAGVGQGLAGLLPAAAADLWLDWLAEAAEAAEPVRFGLAWAEEGSAAEFDLEVTLTAFAEDLIQVVVQASERRDSAEGSPTDAPRPDARLVLDALREPLLLADREGRVLASNAAFERLVGRSRAELAGAAVAELLAAPAARATLAEALAGLAAARGGAEPAILQDLPCLAKGGEQRPLDLRLVPVAAGGGNGGPPAAVLVEVQRGSGNGASAGTAAALEPGGHGEPWFNAIMDSMADGIVALDAAGTITWLSRSAETIFDYPREAAVGAPITLLLTPGAGEEPAAVLERLLSANGGERRAGPRELTARRRSGELIPIEAEATQLDQAGRGRVVILTVRDITVRRQTEEALKSLAYHARSPACRTGCCSTTASRRQSSGRGAGGRCWR